MNFNEEDESENAVLLPQSVNMSLDIEIANENHQSFEVKYNMSDTMPPGKKFILKSDEILYGWTPRCKTCLCILFCLTSILLGTSWLMTEDEYIGTIMTWIVYVILFIFVAQVTSMIIVRIVMCHKEQWLTFIMIINVERNIFYIIDQSSRKRWEISSIGTLNEFSISIKTDKKYKDKVYVMIDGTKLNTKCVRLQEAKHLIALIEDYLNGIYRNDYLSEQFMSGDVLEIVDSNKQNDYNKYDTKALNNGLTALIKRLIDGNDMDKVINGESLNEWRERENDALLNEYKKLIKQRDDERERFREYMNFEPRFDEDYIAKMLLVKCNVSQILSD